MAKNSKSDVAQLQAVFKYLTYRGKPYWSGPVDGRYTDELGNKINDFERNEGIPVTGIISPFGVDLTLRRIREKCRGTPYEDMYGLHDSSIVFSRIKAPSVQIQKPLSDLGLWQEAGNEAAEHVKAAAIDLLLPMAIKQEAVSIHDIEQKTHLKFIVSTSEVLWYSKAKNAFTSELSEEADQYIKNYLAKNGSYAWLSDNMTFISAESYVNAEKLQILLSEYFELNDKLNKIHSQLKPMVQEANEIIKVFQNEYVKQKKIMDGAMDASIEAASLGFSKFYYKEMNNGIEYHDDTENKLNKQFDKFSKNIAKELKEHGHKLGSFGKKLKTAHAYIDKNGKMIARRARKVFKVLDFIGTWIGLGFVAKDIYEYGEYLVNSYFEALPKLKALEKDIMALSEQTKPLENKLDKIAKQLLKKGYKP